MMEWIPFKDQKPGKEYMKTIPGTDIPAVDTYLVTYENSLGFRFVEEAEWWIFNKTEGLGKFIDHECNEICNVIAWMPMPDPYDEDKKPKTEWDIWVENNRNYYEEAVKRCDNCKDRHTDKCCGCKFNYYCQYLLDQNCGMVIENGRYKWDLSKLPKESLPKDSNTYSKEEISKMFENWRGMI